MTSIFSVPPLDTEIVDFKNLLNLVTPEIVNSEPDIDEITNLYNILIERKKDINSLRNLNPIPSDITNIEMYSDAVGEKIILLENRIQALQNIDAAAAPVEIGGRRRRTNRRRNKRSKGSKRRRR
jgi:hypothetical protein